MSTTNVELREFIVQCFSRDELFQFCFAYFRDFFEDHEGSTVGKRALAQGLVEYCERRQFMDNLRANLQRERPVPYADEFGRLVVAEVAPQPRNPRQVFLSHAHQDGEFARRLAQDLRDAGLVVWMTPDSIQPGEQWVSAIDRGLKESGLFVVVLSPDAVRSKWVRSETQWALQTEQKGEATLVPVLFKPCDVAQLSALLSLIQYADFEQDYGQGLDSLCERLGVQTQAMRDRQAAKEAQRKAAAEAQRQRQEAEQSQRNAAAEAAARQHAEDERKRRLAEAAQGPAQAFDTKPVPGGPAKSVSQPALPETLGKPVVSRRAILLGLGTLAAGGLGVVWTANRLSPPSPTPTPDQVVIPTDSSAASGNEITLNLSDGVTMILLRVPAGDFLMGSDKAKDLNAQDDELPQHTVFLSEYYIGKHEVTNAQWAAYAEAKGLAFDKPSGKADHPVVNVSWADAVAFCAWLSQQSGQTARLPTEAQWEKAARGSDGRIYPWGNGFDSSKANSSEADKFDTTPIGSFSPQGDSPYGATDMAGNVWEWCADWYDASLYQNIGAGQVKDPTGPASGEYRVERGGSWNYDETGVRSADRDRDQPVVGGSIVGFRVVVVSPLP